MALVLKWMLKCLFPRVIGVNLEFGPNHSDVPHL